MIHLLQLFDERIIGVEVGIRYGKPAIFIEVDDLGMMPIESDAASISYPELLELAEEYINDASKLQSTLKREQDRNKAKVGCIANVMKPGKANQVSIADNDWVSEKTLKSSQMLGRLNEEIKKMCGL